MPHVTIEYTAGLDASHDMAAVCEAVFQALADHPATPHPDTLKIRALPCPFSRIGTKPATFAHATLMVLPGRDADTKSDLTATLIATLSEHLPDVGSLSADIQDLSPAYAKRVL